MRAGRNLLWDFPGRWETSCNRWQTHGQHFTTPCFFLLRTTILSPAAFLHPFSLGSSSWLKKSLGRDFLTCRACFSLLSHDCGGHRNTTVWRPAIEMPDEALHGNCSWDRTVGAGFRTCYREKNWKVLLGTFYFKNWSTYNLSPCLFCHISSSISPMQTH